VYGGAGSSGATLCDFIELFHRREGPTDLIGWRIEYPSAAGVEWQASPLQGGSGKAHARLQQDRDTLIELSSGPLFADVQFTGGVTMNLGNFSISLAVKDLQASKQFYEKFGFKPFAGDPAQNWLILKNGDHVIGLFQGMFEKNILTFNPGWDSNAQKLDSFTDVRELQRQLKAQGVQLTTEADESTTGPASFMALDPDGNPILFDQHV
jgi:lactoylglutathione lyase